MKEDGVSRRSIGETLFFSAPRNGFSVPRNGFSRYTLAASYYVDCPLYVPFPLSKTSVRGDISSCERARRCVHARPFSACAAAQKKMEENEQTGIIRISRNEKLRNENSLVWVIFPARGSSRSNPPNMGRAPPRVLHLNAGRIIQ